MAREGCRGSSYLHYWPPFCFQEQFLHDLGENATGLVLWAPLQPFFHLCMNSHHFHYILEMYREWEKRLACPHAAGWRSLSPSRDGCVDERPASPLGLGTERAVGNLQFAGGIVTVLCLRGRIAGGPGAAARRAPRRWERSSPRRRHRRPGHRAAIRSDELH